MVFFLEVIKPTLFSFIIFYLNCRILTWLARGQKLFTQNNKINVGFAVHRQQHPGKSVSSFQKTAEQRNFKLHYIFSTKCLGILPLEILFFHNDGINFTADVESITNDVYMTLLEGIVDW